MEEGLISSLDLSMIRIDHWSSYCAVVGDDIVIIILIIDYCCSNYDVNDDDDHHHHHPYLHYHNY